MFHILSKYSVPITYEVRDSRGPTSELLLQLFQLNHPTALSGCALTTHCVVLPPRIEPISPRNAPRIKLCQTPCTIYWHPQNFVYCTNILTDSSRSRFSEGDGPSRACSLSVRTVGNNTVHPVSHCVGWTLKENLNPSLQQDTLYTSYRSSPAKHVGSRALCTYRYVSFSKQQATLILFLSSTRRRINA